MLLGDRDSCDLAPIKYSAVGVTLLVCLTGRSAEGIFDACETDLDTDFALPRPRTPAWNKG